MSVWGRYGAHLCGASLWRKTKKVARKKFQKIALVASALIRDFHAFQQARGPNVCVICLILCFFRKAMSGMMFGPAFVRWQSTERGTAAVLRPRQAIFYLQPRVG